MKQQGSVVAVVKGNTGRKEKTTKECRQKDRRVGLDDGEDELLLWVTSPSHLLNLLKPARGGKWYH